MRKITLCADDFGQTTEICTGIIELVKHNRLSAVSCLTNMPAWENHATSLLSHKNTCDIGLHFNLTEGQPLTLKKYLTLTELLKKTFLRQLKQDQIEQELNAQLDKFTEITGQLPDFIDGHQHVHQFPVIRTALLNVYQQRLASHPIYIRIPSNHFFQTLKNFTAFPKPQIIAFTGALALKKKLIPLNIPHNQSFSGIYNFKNSKNYRYYFQQFLTQIKTRGLIMCHPGKESSQQQDPLYRSRFDEYQYFMSDNFLQDCAKAKILLGRF